jgi:predicted TPR repeat methyltransferase
MPKPQDPHASAEALAVQLAALAAARALVAGARQPAQDPQAWAAALARVAPALASQGASEASARTLVAHGLWREAEACLRAALKRQGERPALLRALAQVLAMTGTARAELDMRTRYLVAEAGALGLAGADQAAAAAFLLAAEGAGPVPAAAPSAFVARHFDLYADLEEHLLERLRYRGHELLAAAVARACPGRCDLRVLDLGCGTGLFGVAARPLAAWLGGIDLSDAMVARARAHGIYDHLMVGEAVAALAAGAEPVDVVAGADLCPYLGDLGPLIGAARVRLRVGGILAITVEAAAQGAPWRLSGTRRYSHADDYLRAALVAGGFTLVELTPAELRREKGEPALGLIACARAAS